jgi:hypothetical protein
MLEAGFQFTHGVLDEDGRILNTQKTTVLTKKGTLAKKDSERKEGNDKPVKFILRAIDTDHVHTDIFFRDNGLTDLSSELRLESTYIGTGTNCIVRTLLEGPCSKCQILAMIMHDAGPPVPYIMPYPGRNLM